VKSPIENLMRMSLTLISQFFNYYIFFKFDFHRWAYHAPNVEDLGYFKLFLNANL